MDRLAFAHPLKGRWLWFARMAWLVAAVLAIGLFFAALPLRFDELRTICTGAACSESQLSPDDVRALQFLHMSIVYHAAYYVALSVLFATVHVLVAVVIFSLKSDDPMALFVSFMLVTFGTATFTGTSSALGDRQSFLQIPGALVSSLTGVMPDWLSRPQSVLQLPIAILSMIGQASGALFFFLFPDGRFVPRWTRWAMLLWIIWQGLATFVPDSALNSANWSPTVKGQVWVCILGVFLFAQLYRYVRVSTPIQKQRTKWVVFGMTGALGGFFVSIVFAAILSSLNQPTLIYRGIVTTTVYVVMLLVPISIGAAILYSRLWDIDVVINRTLVYGTVTVMLALLYSCMVILLQRSVQSVTGQSQSEVVLAVSTLAIAALSSPLLRQVQSSVDRLFYRNKYEAARVMAEYSQRLRNDVDLDKLVNDLLVLTYKALQPSHASLWMVRKKNPDDRSG